MGAAWLRSGTPLSRGRFQTGQRVSPAGLTTELRRRNPMRNTLSALAIIAALAAGASSVAMAQGYPGYACPAGYALYNGVCQPMGYAPSNPVAGAAAGGAAGGPVGAIVGGAIGTATGAVGGAANAATGAPVYGSGYPPPAYGRSYPPPARGCAPGYYWSNGGCYPAR